MILNNEVRATPTDADVDNPTFYTINDFIVPTPYAEGGGLASFTFRGKNGKNFVASVKVRQELDPLYRDEIWLNKQYTEMERSMADIADQFGITPAAINQWLNKHDIPTRNRGRGNE